MKKLLMCVALIATLGIGAAAESPIKLSLIDNIAWPNPKHTNVVLGLLDAKTPEVSGVSLVGISSRADKVNGLSASYAYTVSKELNGVQYGIYNATYKAKGVTDGIVNYNKNAFTGLQIGFVNIAKENIKGVQTGLIVDYAKNLKGAQLAFFVNVAKKAEGAQITLLTNYVNNLDGAQIALLNIAENMRGAQLGAINIVSKEMKGFQLANWVNYAGSLEGMQLALLNIAGDMKGFQLGFVNYAHRMEKGLQIGLFNIIEHNGLLPALVLVNGRF